jgi:acetoin utilization protein AcuB
MLVGERMSHPVIFVHPDLPIHDALNLIKSERIRRLPVVNKHGKLVGIVTDEDLFTASPSQATSLSVWELNYLLSKITVKDIMTKTVITVSEDTPIEEAARILADEKIGGLPVMRDNHIVGIITETNLFKIFLELMGARSTGVRVTALLADTHGKLAELTTAIAHGGGNFVSFSTFAGEDPSNILMACKVTDLTLEQVQTLITPIVEEIVDIRVCCP